jgi:hypothetical protein
MNPGTREEGEEVMEQTTGSWPLLYAERDGGSNRNLYAFQRADSRVSDTEHQTYHPESAPNVLSPEEARRIGHRLECEVGCEVERGRQCTCGASALRSRLRAWAEEEEH